MRSSLLILALSLIAVPLSAADQPPLADLVVTGGPRPIRVRIVVSKSGRPWKQMAEEAHQRHVQAVFNQLDSDHNERLTAEEAARFPTGDTFNTRPDNEEVFVAFNFRALDTNGDGAVGAEEFSDYLRQFGDTTLKLTSVPVKQSSDDLFRALDANRNRIVSAEEWSATAQLTERDKDGNHVLVPEELRGPKSAALPPEFVAGARKTTLLQFTLGASDGMPADAELTVAYADPDGATPTPPFAALTIADSAKDLGLRLEGTAPEKKDPGTLTLTFAGHRIVLRIPPSGPTPASQRQALVDGFVAAMERTQGQVTAGTELPPLLKALFSLSDANGDGKLERVELDACLDRLLPARLAAHSTRLRMVVFEEQAGLMGIADANRDGRLGVRELRELSARITTVAGDKQELRRDEVPATSVIVLQTGPFGPEPEADALSGAGPAWFVRADRNRDGDLNSEEFLGTPEDFKRLDADGDGLIDVQESLKAAVP